MLHIKYVLAVYVFIRASPPSTVFSAPFRPTQNLVPYSACSHHITLASLELHKTARALHQWTRLAKKTRSANASASSSARSVASTLPRTPGSSNAGATQLIPEAASSTSSLPLAEGNEQNDEGQGEEKVEEEPEIDGEMNVFQAPVVCPFPLLISRSELMCEPLCYVAWCS